MALTNRDLQLIRQLLKEEVKDEMLEFKRDIKNDVLQFKDDILTEIVKLREDVTIITGYRTLIENHEERLDTIEVKLHIPQA